MRVSAMIRLGPGAEAPGRLLGQMADYARRQNEVMDDRQRALQHRSFAVGGLRSRLVGLNPRFSRAVGIEPAPIFLATMIVSGAIGGLAGGIHALGLVHRFVNGGRPRGTTRVHRTTEAGLPGAVMAGSASEQ